MCHGETMSEIGKNSSTKIILHVAWIIFMYSCVPNKQSTNRQFVINYFVFIIL